MACACTSRVRYAYAWLLVPTYCSSILQMSLMILCHAAASTGELFVTLAAEILYSGMPASGSSGPALVNSLQHASQ